MPTSQPANVMSPGRRLHRSSALVDRAEVAMG